MVLLLSLYRAEPYYEGKSLSDWIIAMGFREGKEKEHQVVHYLGTNSIPLLLEWLQRPDKPSLVGRFENTQHRVIYWLESHNLMKPRTWGSKMDWKGSYRSLALRGFAELGQDGSPAIPALIKLLATKPDTTNEIGETAGAASLALAKMAPASISPLIEAASSADDQIYGLAAMALGNIGPDAKAAIPTIEKRFRDPRPDVRVGAAYVIDGLGGEPSEFMPVVIEALRDPNLRMLDYKLQLIFKYKEHAKGAVPILRDILRNIPVGTTNLTQMFVRDQAKGALHQLAPDVFPPSRVNE
jgi:HEAT repeat protein